GPVRGLLHTGSVRPGLRASRCLLLGLAASLLLAAPAADAQRAAPARARPAKARAERGAGARPRSVRPASRRPPARPKQRAAIGRTRAGTRARLARPAGRRAAALRQRATRDPVRQIRQHIDSLWS